MRKTNFLSSLALTISYVYVLLNACKPGGYLIDVCDQLKLYVTLIRIPSDSIICVTMWVIEGGFKYFSWGLKSILVCVKTCHGHTLNPIRKMN